MHEFAKKIMECVKTNVEAIGIDNFSGQNLDDLKDWTEIAKNIVCYDKDYKIVEAMKKSEDEEEIMRKIERYEDYPERRFYDHYRYSDGRFAPKGHGTYRGYSEPYYHMTPEMYRDMDRHTHGRMYYTETGMNESGYDRAKRTYTETKEMHRGNTPEDKKAKMQELERYAKSLTEDVVEMVSDMSDEEKNLLRTKMQILMQKIQ